ncbi:MAG: hypothetical protein QG628_83 [Patescibacteria group bacterium]|jgi:multisubunit Na+/H+ antiporter MnhB subunit|nr:hypothetical protein [Patescibacteria group bacterium]
MGPLQKLEDKLNPMLTKNAPFQIPENAKKWIVKYMPIIGLVVGVLGLFAALALWNAAHAASTLVDYANELSKAYGTGETVKNVGVSFYLAFIMLLITSIIPIVAYSGLKAHSKTRGWNLLYISALLSLVYGVFNAFYYGSPMNLISTFIGSAISLYILFQIRSYYQATKSVSTPKVQD